MVKQGAGGVIWKVSEQVVISELKFTCDKSNNKWDKS